MTTMRRVWRGTLFGVLAAWIALPAMMSFYYRPGDKLDLIPMLGWTVFLLPFVLVIAGPGAFFLSWVHAVQMENWAPRARSVRQIRKVGILTALPLGLANLALAWGVICLIRERSLTVDAEVLPWLIPAIAGGAGLGWGVTIGLTPGRAAPARATVRPRLRRAIRRDGPPFFDNRGSRPRRAA